MLPQDTSALSPETSNSFEVGLKSRFFNDMLRFNIAAFLDKFKNYQVNFFDTFNGSPVTRLINAGRRSEEHTSELQSLMRISYAVFCLKKKNHQTHKK